MLNKQKTKIMLHFHDFQIQFWKQPFYILGWGKMISVASAAFSNNLPGFAGAPELQDNYDNKENRSIRTLSNIKPFLFITQPEHRDE